MPGPDGAGGVFPSLLALYARLGRAEAAAEPDTGAVVSPMALYALLDTGAAAERRTSQFLDAWRVARGRLATPVAPARALPRPPPPAESSFVVVDAPRRFELTFGPGAIGLQLETDFFGCRCIVRGTSEAFRARQGEEAVAVGDVVVAINGFSVESSPFEDAMALLREATRPMTVTFASVPA